MNHRCKRFGMLIMSVLAGIAAPTAAQNYPNRVVRVIVPWAAGGATDILSRIVAQKMSESWGQQVIVDNRPGASGIIGTELAARAPADGYTLLMGAAAPNSILPNLSTKLPYDAIKDFAPISRIGTTGYVLSVHPSLPAKSVRELLALGKANPGQFTFSSAGEGTPIHLSGEMFKAVTRLDMRHVPYKNSPQATMDVMGGQITMTFDNIAPSLPHIKSGKLKALAITTLKRSVLLPEVPTIAESGFPGFESVGWFGLMAPRGTPGATIVQLNREALRILTLPDVRDRLLGLGVENLGSTPEELDAFTRSELAKWGKVIKDSGIKPE